MQRLKDVKEAKKFREELLTQQKNIDPILNIPITRPVLDHQHFPNYNCRGVLQNEVNAFEGKVFNAYRRYLKHLTKAPLVDILKSLILYLEKDNTKMPIHYTAIKDELRPFKRLSAKEQINTLKGLNIAPACTAKKRLKQMQKVILEGKQKQG